MPTENRDHRSTFIIAELSANHGGSLQTALDTIDAFAAAGANAIKVQTFRPDSLCLNIPNEYFGPRKSGLWTGRTLWEIYSEAALPYEWHSALFERCQANGVEFFSSPFDCEAVDFLEEIGVTRYKIASMEITDLPLIQRAARTQKPIILSTGLAEEQDIRSAIDTCRSAGNEQITILKCTSNYPATIDDANLSTITDMRSRFGVEVGLSDHTLGFIAPMTAVALGASVIEKHVILNKDENTLDAAFSLEPGEFAEMVSSVREVERSLGTTTYYVSPNDKLRRRSLFITRDLTPNDVLQHGDIRSVRPGHGAPPATIQDFMGKRPKHPIPAGTPANPEDFE